MEQSREKASVKEQGVEDGQTAEGKRQGTTVVETRKHEPSSSQQEGWNHATAMHTKAKWVTQDMDGEGFKSESSSGQVALASILNPHGQSTYLHCGFGSQGTKK